eukprot:COSAG04_NODE_3430_length_2820_cov_1.661154_1_plen_230_part_10
MIYEYKQCIRICSSYQFTCPLVVSAIRSTTPTSPVCSRKWADAAAPAAAKVRAASTPPVCPEPAYSSQPPPVARARGSGSPEARAARQLRIQGPSLRGAAAGGRGFRNERTAHQRDCVGAATQPPREGRAIGLISAPVPVGKAAALSEPTHFDGARGCWAPSSLRTGATTTSTMATSQNQPPEPTEPLDTLAATATRPPTQPAALNIQEEEALHLSAALVLRAAVYRAAN